VRLGAEDGQDAQHRQDPVVVVRGREDRVFIGRNAHGELQARPLTADMRATLALFADPQAEANGGA
jgi:hypothetical protein